MFAAVAETETATPKEKPKRKPPKRKQVEETARRYFAALQARDAEGDGGLLERGRGRGHRPAARDARPRGGPASSSPACSRPCPTPRPRSTTWWPPSARRRWSGGRSGTFTGSPFEGVEATGGRLELRGLDLLEIEDDRILKNTAYFDNAAFMRQLGMLPPQDSGPERAMKTAFNTVNKVKRTVAEKRGPR